MRISASALALLCALLAAPALASAEPAPFGHKCKAENGVRFCPTGTLAERVPSFDKVPLDADVTLPATGEGPWPTIVMIHGWGGNKTSFETTTPGSGNETFDYNNIYYAQHGYAVVNYTARGWGRSCGSKESREANPVCEERGWIRLDDTRYEARDVQYMTGVLADEGITKNSAVGVTGISYGGGLSIELAYLRNQVRLENGSLAPWRSPKGKKMKIAAAYPRWPWSDLVSALEPNGRYLDSEVETFKTASEPLGVSIQSYVAGLYALGNVSGFYAPAGKDPEADLTKWFGAVNAGEPATKEDEEIATKIETYHQGYGLPGKPAPLLIQNGWTDDLFPPKEALRVYNALKGKAVLQFGDLGHSRGSNNLPDDKYFQEEGAAFFGAYLQHSGPKPKLGRVTAFTQKCPGKVAGGGPFIAKSWAKLHPHKVSFGSAATQMFTGAGGSSKTAAEFDPIANSESCKSVKAEEEANTANYNLTSTGFTLLGLPTIQATVKVTGQAGGADGEIVGRLWDVTPSGEQRLISRGVWRTTEKEASATPISFQLHGNGYEFPKGHTVRLQLLGSDSPYYRASNNKTFVVEVTNLTVSLPTL
jgi:fermentation-respiration switch protein FrsA (DUF1100 family)